MARRSPMFMKCLALAVLGASALWHLTRDSPKYEMARRTGCVGNLNRLANGVQTFRQANGRWPAGLRELPADLANLRCPSASAGPESSAPSHGYRWDAGQRTLSEEARNHDDRRLGLRRLPPVRHVVTFGAEGGWHLARETQQLPARP